MNSFEEIGRKIDAEVERLRHYIEGEVKPATERKLIEALRTASKRLGELAEKVEARAARAAGKEGN